MTLNINKIKIALLISSFLVLATTAFSQGPPPHDQNAGTFKQQRERGPEMPSQLSRELGLSQEQVGKLRELNQQHRPLLQEATKKLRETNRELDIAIYADVVNEEVIAEKLLNFQMAQNEVAKLRFESELQIRKILTHDQLVKFRELREKAVERRPSSQRRMKNVQQRRQKGPAPTILPENP